MAFFPNSVLAKGEFSSSYDITYDVAENGQTEVTEKVTLKNLTDRYYPSNFNLVIAVNDVTDLFASDSQGILQTSSTPVNGKTQINIKFNQQIAGKGKEYTWILKFKTIDFALNSGKIWDISIPKLSSAEDIENYNVNLLTPVSFGDPSVIVPKPNKQKETAGKLQYTFTKEQLLGSGISAVFGDTQTYNFKLTYNLVNNGFLPKVFELSLPSNSPFQKALISSIEPKPDNVILDEEGNYLALFTVDRTKSQVVEAKGQVQTFINPLYRNRNLNMQINQRYFNQDKYWEKDNPLIKEKLKEIFNGKTLKTNSDKANLINQYVSSVLQFNTSNNIGYRRLGAVTALNNTNQAKCYEFSDLFIAFARSAKIPTRENIGLGYRGNSKIRPECFPNSNLDIWPEYYDENSGWVMIDPTWESTTGGANYSSKLDLNHISLLKQSSSFSEVAIPVKSEFSFLDKEFKPVSNVRLSIDVSETLFASLPAQAKIRIENLGNIVYQVRGISLSGGRINVLSQFDKGQIDIPPLGSFEQNVALKTGYAWDSYVDILQLKINNELNPVNNKTIEKSIVVKPLFAYKRLSITVGAIFLLIFGTYLTTLILHLKDQDKKIFNIKIKKKKK